MNIGTSIKTIRKEKGLSQKRLAELTEISVTALVQIENNSSLPRKSTFERIAQVLGTSSSYVMVCAINEQDVRLDMREVFSQVKSTIKLMLK